MRLIRFPERPARVSDDIRASLASFRKGTDTLGGFALLGVQPPGFSRSVDAVVVLPHGVSVIIGIDLPHPAIRLEAPLSAPWILDGWPLVSTDDVVNPAVDALAFAHTVTRRIRDIDADVPTGIILAVGPYVAEIEQPASDRTESVRVVYPVTTNMVEPILSLLPAGAYDLNVERADNLLHELSPEVQHRDSAIFTAEGFSPNTQDKPVSTTSQDNAPVVGPRKSVSVVSEPHSQEIPTETVPAEPSESSPEALDNVDPVFTVPKRTPMPHDVRSPYAVPVPAPRRLQGTVRRAFITVGLLVIVATTAITIANTKSTSDTAPDEEAKIVTAHGISFTEVAAASESRCADHAVGDIEVFLEDSECRNLQRRSFSTDIAGKNIAVSVTTVDFTEEDQALAFHTLANTPGTGIIPDLALENDRWPDPVPTFDNAAYATRHEGNTVRIVQATVRGSASDPDDPNLVEITNTALTITLRD